MLWNYDDLNDCLLDGCWSKWIVQKRVAAFKNKHSKNTNTSNLQSTADEITGTMIDLIKEEIETEGYCGRKTK
jgi:hypothetical protein